MVDKTTLNLIYETTPNNLECYLHPEYKINLRFLNDEEMVVRAKNLLELIEEGSPDVVLYSETGVWPISYIGSSIQGKVWTPIKCPREAVGYYENIVLFLLTQEERASILPEDVILRIKDFCKSEDILVAEIAETCNREQLIYLFKDYLNLLFIEKTELSLPHIFNSLGDTNKTHKLFNLILEGTSFYKLLLGHVTYVDEYIDSGTTLLNTFNVLKCFNSKLKFNIVSYYVFSEFKHLDQKIIKSLYSEDDGVNAFIPGAYPYENRLDIIGHFYLMGESGFKKVDIFDLNKEYDSVADVENIALNDFLDRCLAFIDNSNILSTWIGKYKIKEVTIPLVINKESIFRYLIYLFENRSKDSFVTAKLLWNLFDMYGPAWSPLPDDYHLDFWHATEFLEEEIILADGFSDLELDYVKFREQVLREIINICYKKNKDWKEKIDIIINN